MHALAFAQYPGSVGKAEAAALVSHVASAAVRPRRGARSGRRLGPGVHAPLR